jgi:predicted methyltransferase
MTKAEKKLSEVKPVQRLDLTGMNKMVTDIVNKPPHYTNRRVEVIDQMITLFGKEAVINYCEISAFKYRMRAGYKNDIAEDINKALWYEKKLKELLQIQEG